MAYARRHEECVLFLEDGFGTTDCRQRLIESGFSVVCFADDFHEEKKKKERVADPRIIRHCHDKQYVLVTLDKNLRRTHLEDIKKTDIAIIATESCDKFSPLQWVDALIKAKSNILRKVKKFPRPWYAHLAIHGKLRKIETITEEMITRRTRPKEQDKIGEDNQL